MWKNDNYYVDWIRKDLDFIMAHMSGISKEELEKQPLLQDSMMFRLIQISESAKNLTEDFLESHSHIPWMDIFGLRNRIVHDYGNVDLSIVFDTLTKDIPELYQVISEDLGEY